MLDIIAINQNFKITESLFRKLISYISEDRNRKVVKFNKWEDAQRALLSDVLVRGYIERKKGIKNKDIIFNTNKFGKPYLINNNDFYFNISHSGRWVVGVFSDCEVGIDIEEIKPIDLSIAENFFSREEYSYLMNVKQNEQLLAFYELWTIKESYIKAIGMGLSIPLSDFTITINEQKIIHVKESRVTGVQFDLKLYDIDPMYKLSVCSSKKIYEETFSVMPLNEFIKNHLII